MSLAQAKQFAQQGAAHLAQGDAPRALASHLMALAIAPQDHAYRREALALLGMMGHYTVPERVRTILTDCAWDERLEAQPLASVLHNDYHGAELLSEVQAVLESSPADLDAPPLKALYGDPLLKAVLARALIITPDLERALTGLRRAALIDVAQADGQGVLKHLAFFAALSTQAINGEFVFDVTAEEEGLLDALAPTLAGSGPACVVFAAYRPLPTDLNALPNALEQAAETDRVIAFFLKRSFFEPREEARLLREIPSLEGAVERQAGETPSAQVRAQYQRYPYPRWIDASLGEPKPFATALRECFPKHPLGGLPKGPIDLLIAGCGTGRQVAHAVSHFETRELTAVDLSAPSLAYAKRALGALGFTQINFAEADLLTLPDWPERFDVIECLGVLHHMAEPDDGLASLVKVLKPGGFLRIGLYRERARGPVTAARHLIQEWGLRDAPADIREARRRLRALPTDHPAHAITLNTDFYATSGLHDYIFNVIEHQYRPAEGARSIAKFLKAAGLTFVGFDNVRPDKLTAYRRRFIADPRAIDLTNWDAFEADHPDCFAGMYQFWCRKPAA